MTTADFKIGDMILVEVTSYDRGDGTKKPVKVITKEIFKIEERRNKKFILN